MQLLENCEKLNQFLKQEYKSHFHITAKGTMSHNVYINHCLLYAFRECCQPHSCICNKSNAIFEVFVELKNNSEEDTHEELAELHNYLYYYMAYQICKVYLNEQFNVNLLDLDENKALILVDYKMKILPKSARETKQDWFRKNGWTLHSVLVYTTHNNSTRLKVQVFDH